MELNDKPQSDWREVFISTVIYWLVWNTLVAGLSQLNLESQLIFLPFVITPLIVSFLFVKRNKRTFLTPEAFLTMFLALSPVTIIFIPALLLNFSNAGLNFSLFLIAIFGYTLSSVFLKGISDRLAKVK